MTSRVNARAVLGVPLVGLFVLASLLGPLVAPYGVRAIDLTQELAPLSRAHWLGTAENGVDVLSVLLHGARLVHWTPGAGQRNL